MDIILKQILQEIAGDEVPMQSRGTESQLASIEERATLQREPADLEESQSLQEIDLNL